MKYPSKIISGGQTGADQGGLVAGKELGLKVGGTAPYNWMTDDGKREELLKSFGLVSGEYDKSVYVRRTLANVRDSDGTVLFGKMWTPGCRLTIKSCEKYGKPYKINPTPAELREWVVGNKISVLNIAGNRERLNPGIKGKTINVLTEGLQNCEE